MADRPAWRCRTDDEQAEFKHFVIADLELRFMQLGAPNADLIASVGNEPPPADRRRKPAHVRALDPVELAARAVPLIRDIFEDYWTEGRAKGRLYRGHDPSAEQIAAEFGGVTVEQLEQRLKKAKHRRPELK
ncbi:MAG: hypothetical protein ACTHN4_11110 [Sphingomicrobium sp.]